MRQIILNGETYVFGAAVVDITKTAIFEELSENGPVEITEPSSEFDEIVEAL